MLYERFYEPCSLMERTREPDGEGGWMTVWEPVSEFEAAITLDSSENGVIAESAEMIRAYTVTAPVGTSLGFHSVFKRQSDGQGFRVLSVPRDITTPGVATFQFEQVKAEAWEIPDAE